MHRVLAREAGRIIADTFPWATDPRASAALELSQCIELGAIGSVIDGVPEELLPLGEDRTRLITAVGAMRAALGRWSTGGHPGHSVRLGGLAAIGGHPVSVAHTILNACPDEAPSVDEDELPFVPNPDARL